MTKSTKKRFNKQYIYIFQFSDFDRSNSGKISVKLLQVIFQFQIKCIFNSNIEYPRPFLMELHSFRIVNNFEIAKPYYFQVCNEESRYEQTEKLSIILLSNVNF